MCSFHRLLKGLKEFFITEFLNLLYKILHLILKSTS